MTVEQAFKYLSGKEALISAKAGLYPGISIESYVTMEFNGRNYLKLMLGSWAKKLILNEICNPLSNKIREELKLGYNQRDEIDKIIREYLKLDFEIGHIYTHDVSDLKIEYSKDGSKSPYALEMTNSKNQVIRIYDIKIKDIL